MSGEKPAGILIGQKGVKYGLQKVAPKKPGQLIGAPKPAANAPRKLTPGNVFGDNDSEEEDVEKQIARQADKKRAAAKVQQLYEEALAQDPAAFDYDGVYDSMQAARAAPKQQDKVQRQSKYIASLLDQAQARKREQDVLYERRMVKEREAEDHLYEGKERFVTGAYRRKLEEDKKWAEEAARKEAEEAAADVRKVGHLGNFYANLLTKNVAYGGKGEDQDRDKERDKARRSGSPSPGPGPGGDDGEDGERGGGARGDPRSQDRSASPSAAAPGGAHKVLAGLDAYDRLRLEAERRRREGSGQPLGEEAGEAGQARGEGEDEGAARRREEAVSGAGAGAGAGAGREGSGAEQRPGPDGGGSGGAEQPGGGAGAGAGAVGKRRNDDSSVQSARERYLARKQQRT
ncbi:hypothetical protein HXX76_010912 [Chlamydomonas incerta]|uniref:Nuclear speckle splicing regulatory protein 1 N-terminal domain-containing protein n=1 Tax=Chlamydomonas incerta TaxID=51695 RepID=A0A835SHP6_CHLIN|nr:hypothetical protein HXX76_010912 [Chlamydomonas incerta]|eukprot:KAG2427194.1 hypothetical protein HXX76_010912 [Chlamydomonas incerta]